jgi:O-acetyl-ADP-ribose deacetylase (regulator of RNase III)
VKLLIRDRNPHVIAACARAFGPLAECSVGDIFDLKADAVVSPANSFGFMNGGIDLFLEARLKCQSKLQAMIRERGIPELLVGEALAVPVEDPDFKYLIAAPTMRVPMDIRDTVNIYLAFRAALRTATLVWVQTLLTPVFGTGTGMVGPNIAAAQMRMAYAWVIEGKQPDLFADINVPWRENHEISVGHLP